MPVTDSSILPGDLEEIPGVLIVWDREDSAIDQRMQTEIVPEITRRLSGWRVFTELDPEMLLDETKLTIERAYHQTRYTRKLLVFFSPKLTESSWLNSQIRAFRKSWGTVVPFIIMPCNIPLGLELEHPVDCTGDLNWTEIEREMRNPRRY